MTAQRGACYGHPDPDMWTLDTRYPASNQMARIICRGNSERPACPIILECTKWAIDTKLEGHIAGFSEDGKYVRHDIGKKCRVCRKWIPSTRVTCSPECGEIHERRREAERQQRARESRSTIGTKGECRHCKGEFVKNNNVHHYCSDACRMAAHNAKRPNRRGKRKANV